MSIQTSFTSKSISTFTPESVLGLDFWLDATDTTTIQSSGNAVTGWQNKGTQNFTATPSLGTPTTGSNWNGLNYVSCPSGSRLAFTSAFNSTTDQTWFVVARGQNQVVNTGDTCIFVRNAANDYFALRRSQSASQWGVFQIVLARANTIMVLSTSTDLSVGQVSRPRDPFGSVMSYCGINDTIYPTASNVVTVCGSPPVPLSTTTTASGYTSASSVYTVGDTNNLIGWDFFEIMRYSRALSEAERQGVEGYIAWKYFMRVAGEEGFVPTSLSNCVLWLDAGHVLDFSSNFGTVPPSSVTSWLDKSGKGNHVTPVNALFRYEYSSDREFPGDLYFRGLDSGFGVSYPCPLSIGSNTPVTLFAAVSPPNPAVASPSNTIISLNCFPGTRGSQIALIADASLSRYVLAGGTVGTVGNSTSIRPSHPRYDILSGYWSPGSSQLFSAGAATPISSNAPTLLRAGATSLIGGNTSNNANSTTITNKWSGAIAEIIVYDRTLTENERNRVERYIANKWLFELSTTTQYAHPFRTSIPQQRRFTPPDIVEDDIIFWIDAADPSTFTLSGTNLATITDKAPTPSTLTIGGTVGYDTTTLNNRPSFNLSNGRIIANVLATPISNNSATVIFVGYLFNNPASITWPAIATSSNTTNTGARWRISEFNNSSTRNVWTNSSSQTVSIAPAVAIGTPYIWAAGLGPSSNTTRRYMGYLNDGSGINFTTANSSTSTVANQLHLRVGGDLSIGLTSNTYPGCIGEVIVYNGLLSLSDLRRVSGYLCEKWDLAGSYPQFSYFRQQGAGSTPVRTNDPPFLRSSTIIWLDAAEPYAARYKPAPALDTSLNRWENKSVLKPSDGFTFGQPMVQRGSVIYTLDGIYPAMYFDGASYMRSWDFPNIFTNTFSIVVVGRTTQPNAQHQTMFFNNRTAGQRYFSIGAQSSQGRFDITYNNVTPVRRATSNYTASTRAGIHIINQPGLAEPTFFLNGSLVGITTSSGSISTSGFSSNDGVGLFLGVAMNASGNILGYLTGYIYEVIVTNAVLPTIERQRLEGYLAWKWGIVDLLPSTHPFKRIAP